MGKVSETIWANDNVIIPMAEVSHIEKIKDSGLTTDRISVIFKHSKWNEETQSFEPNAYMDSNSNSNEFLADYCKFRAGLDSEIIEDAHLQG